MNLLFPCFATCDRGGDVMRVMLTIRIGLSVAIDRVTNLFLLRGMHF